MRSEIKLRFWSKKENKFVTLPRIWVRDDGTLDYEYGDGQELIIQRYTGLKDRNNKEIYEGDIVYHPNLSNNMDENFIIEFWDGGFYLTHIKRIYGGLRIKEKECKIIGNIFENSNLLQ